LPHCQLGNLATLPSLLSQIKSQDATLPSLLSQIPYLGARALDSATRFLQNHQKGTQNRAQNRESSHNNLKMNELMSLQA
jgi:hypothetical protein